MKGNEARVSSSLLSLTTQGKRRMSGSELVRSSLTWGFLKGSIRGSIKGLS